MTHAQILFMVGFKLEQNKIGSKVYFDIAFIFRIEHNPIPETKDFPIFKRFKENPSLHLIITLI